MSTQGTASLDFGAYPGSSQATVSVTGQTGILSDSLVEAWVIPTATADHSVDEVCIEALKVIARDTVAGTGFSVMGVALDPGSRCYGAFNVGWVWI